MTERYFEGFDFSVPIRPFESVSPTIMEEYLYEQRDFSELEEEIVCFPPITDLSLDEPAQIEPLFNWSFDIVLTDFKTILGKMEKSLGVNLPIDKRYFFNVEAQKFIPEVQEERERLAQKYGEYILNGIDGSCERLENDEGFLIMVGFKGREDSVDHLRVLSVLAHEYGHSLGENIKDVENEELKADAFSNLFMRFYYDVDEYWDDCDLSPDKKHDIATHKLNLLRIKGNREEEILAQLTGINFGGFSENSYLQHLQN
jgi:hypothetical protein